MRTVSLKSVLESVAIRAGISPDSGSYTPEFVAMLVDFVTDRTSYCWEYEFWPEWTPTELRAYADSWDIATDYVEGDQVYNDADGAYYQCLVDNTGLQPDENPTEWGDVDDTFVKVVAYDQTGKTQIGEVMSCSRRDPRRSSSPGFLKFLLTEEGIQLGELAPNTPYIRFRKRPPVFTSTIWVADTEYTAGQYVYDDVGGDAYLCLGTNTGNRPSTDAGGFWELQPIPYVLARPIKRYVYADVLEEDGQASKAAKAAAEAENLLMDAVDIAIPQQTQVKYAQYRSATSAPTVSTGDESV